MVEYLEEPVEEIFGRSFWQDPQEIWEFMHDIDIGFHNELLLVFF